MKKGLFTRILPGGTIVLVNNYHEMHLLALGNSMFMKSMLVIYVVTVKVMRSCMSKHIICMSFFLSALFLQVNLNQNIESESEL